MSVSFYTFLYIYTALFNPIPFMLMLCVVTFCMYRERGGGTAGFFVLTLFSVTGITHLIKEYLAIPRPAGNLLAEVGYGFPSMHATVSTVFFLLLLYIWLPVYTGYKKYMFIGLCLFTIITVSLSRVLFQVHSLEQVLWGISFGLLWVILALRLKESLYN